MRRRLRNWLCLILLLAAPPSGFSALAAAARVDETKTSRSIIFGVPGLGMTSFAVRVAIDKGFFSQRNLRVSPVLASSNVIMSALIAGDMQFTNSSGGATYSALQGVPLRTIAYFQTEPYSLVVLPTIRTIADLRGKTIGTLALSGNTGVYLAHALAHGNLTLKDVQPVATTDSGRAQGLLTRNFHGAVTSPPATQQLIAQGMRVLTGPEITDIPANGLATTLQMLQKEPDLVRAMIESLVDAVIWTRSHPDEAIAYFGEKFKLPQVIAAEAYKQQMQVLRWNPTDQQLENAVKLALAALKLGQRAKVGDAIDLGIYREILRNRGLKD